MRLFLKRLFDIILSLIGLVILLPIFIIIIILIKIDSKGPAFFYQERLGKNGRVFKIIKFRTMVINAENIGDGLDVKSDCDERITKVGSFLRKTSLDELPQFINVFIGNMSFIGPRPPVVYHPYDGYSSYPDWAKTRFNMKPGITGLAQIRVRNSVVWDERIIIDNEYIENFSVLLDIKILLDTFLQVIKKENIY